jgi:hypothetical protein
LSNTKLEDYSYLTGIVWIPMGVVAHSAILIGLGMTALALGLFLHIFRRNQQVEYTTIRFPNREEDETIEFHRIQQDHRDHADQKQT